MTRREQYLCGDCRAEACLSRLEPSQSIITLLYIRAFFFVLFFFPYFSNLKKWHKKDPIGMDCSSGASLTLMALDRRWFMEAMQAQTVDVIKRMKDITLVMQTPEQVLESQGVTAADIEDMLDELQEHVEAIDMANDLHSIGGLVPLLGYLKNSHANIRAKAADVVTTIVQNNPRSQQLVMDANGLEPLLSNFTSDPDVTAFEPKHLEQYPELLRLNLANGYAGLRDALSSENVRFQRKALNLIHYLLHENWSDCYVVTELGFPRIMMHLASSEDAEVREAALRGLLELARDRPGGTTNGSSLGDEDEKLKQILQERINGISLMSPEDLGATKEERQLVDSLWNVCYKEPSSLREKGLLVLPGEDALPPDVASQHFEPPLRAWAANRTVDSNPSTEKKETPTPLLLGPGSLANTCVQSSSNADADAGENHSSDTGQ
ncbi:Hsp70 nucleotide exchange factor FES1 [Camellia lanceoleosa]|uniref:Hsp70 nucleotide exchange factor FES1 n=1 Tax=Camellia lanceoleosa TaxID=1840588 RepID=A0ACC0HV48_9ERIC|nr:Hsp70 nucleotide exchange factor FES1 [Camellia lanceoleosa]